MTPSAANPIPRARRGLAQQRWITVLTTAATGTVLVALASRLGTAAALATALLASVAVAAAARRAHGDDRRWRRLDTTLAPPRIPRARTRRRA